MTGDDPAGEAAVDGGSYRDRSSKVFYHEGAVLRALDARAAANWEHLAATRFFVYITNLTAKPPRYHIAREFRSDVISRKKRLNVLLDEVAAARGEFQDAPAAE